MGFFTILVLIVVVLIGLSIFPLFTIGCIFIGAGNETGYDALYFIGGIIILISFFRH